MRLQKTQNGFYVRGTRFSIERKAYSAPTKCVVWYVVLRGERVEDHKTLREAKAAVLELIDGDDEQEG